jgi:hypothetical protein
MDSQKEKPFGQIQSLCLRYFHFSKGEIMSGTNLPIKSREYKMMLNVDRFNPRPEGMQRFIKLVSFLITEKFGGTIVPQASQPPTKELLVIEEKQRTVAYLDTPDLALKQQGYSLRLRDTLKVLPGQRPNKPFQINLKYRGSDRYLSAIRDIRAAAGGDPPEFEEDIAPPFVSKYSHSVSIKTSELPDLQTFTGLAELFPSLASLPIHVQTPIKPINGFIANEVAFDLSKFMFDGQTKIEPKLSFWYFLNDKDDLPLVGEFSYTFKFKTAGDNELEQSPTQTVENAYQLFSSLQGHPGWFNFNLLNKTSFAVDTI